MSKTVFNPYRDLLDIPSLKDENPTDYQLLGIEDFESDSEKIAAAHEKRSQRIADLYQLITRMSQQIDEARDRVSDSQRKEEYDNLLRKTGRAGVAHLGKRGSLAVLFSFVLSIFIVVISTFYIYPMVVTIPPENYGDSVTTLPDYNETQTQKEIDILKVQQEDISTMDVNFNLPIDVDADSSVDFLDVPATDIPGEETSIDDLSVTDIPLDDGAPAAEQPEELEVPAIEEPTTQPPEAEEPAAEEPAEPEVPALEAPAIEEPAAPEEPAVDQPAIEEPAAPEEPAVEEPPLPETPADEQPSPSEEPVDEQRQTPEVPDVPEVEQPEVESPAEPEEQTIERPSEDSPEVLVDPEIPDTPPLPDVPDRVDSQVEAGSAADRVGSQVEAGSSAPGLFGGITSSTRPRGSAPGSFGGITSSTRPRGFAPDSDTPTVPKLSDRDNAGIPELPPLEEIAVSDPPEAPQPPVIPELAADSDVTRGTGITRHQTTLDNADNVRSPETLPAEKLREASNEWRENASVTQNPLATRNSQLATRPNGVVLEDVDKLDQFVQMGQKARTDEDFAQLLVSARLAEEELMKEKQFQKAQQIADVVYASCARLADKSYRAAAYQHKEIVSRRAAWWDAARVAEAKMQSNGSVSPLEATIVARWKIEVEDDWETGLKYLAFSDNEQIQLAVKRDLAANPENVRHCLVVANDWWNLSQDPVPMQKQYRQRASMWYSKALPSIADKQIRTLVEKRISMVDQGFVKH